jgi:hypothetical protein
VFTREDHCIIAGAEAGIIGTRQSALLRHNPSSTTTHGRWVGNHGGRGSASILLHDTGSSRARQQLQAA